MALSPLMLSEKDRELLGAASRGDAMGVLAVWSDRARNLVPHLTEQTTDARGFQILVEAFRLWEFYEPEHPDHAGQLDSFFLLVEQSFARIIGRLTQGWPLPGTRRVKARCSEKPAISLADPSWHLLDGQKANGLWGLYRGAARRAGLLEDGMQRLSDETREAASNRPGIKQEAREVLFKAIKHAMDRRTAPLPDDATGPLARDINDTYRKLPLAAHLKERLIDIHPLNQELARRLGSVEKLDHRTLLGQAADELPEHKATLDEALRCEGLLAVVESIFFWLCCRRGDPIEIAAELPVKLDDIRKAQGDFAQSGIYNGAIAKARFQRLCEKLDATDKVALARSVLELHEDVSKERKREVWLREEGGRLVGEAEVEEPAESMLQAGVAWRNDFYLEPLMNIARQLEAALA